MSRIRRFTCRRTRPGNRRSDRPENRPRITIRRAMIAIAAIALLLAAAVNLWKAHQRAEFARLYPLGALDLGGEKVLIRVEGSTQPPGDPGAGPRR